MLTAIHGSQNTATVVDIPTVDAHKGKRKAQSQPEEQPSALHHLPPIVRQRPAVGLGILDTFPPSAHPQATQMRSPYSYSPPGYVQPPATTHGRGSSGPPEDGASGGASPPASASGRALSSSKRAEQNRKAQRAFRERRDAQLKSLQQKADNLDAALASADEANRRWEETRAQVDQLRLENAALRQALQIAGLSFQSIKQKEESGEVIRARSESQSPTMVANSDDIPHSKES